MLSFFGQQAVVSIFIHLIIIATTWWALQSFKFELFFRDVESPQAKVLMILLTIAIGSTVSHFFLMYYQWATQLQYLF